MVVTSGCSCFSNPISLEASVSHWVNGGGEEEGSVKPGEGG